MSTILGLLNKMKWMSGVCGFTYICYMILSLIGISTGQMNAEIVANLTVWQDANWAWWGTMIITVGGGMALKGAAKNLNVPPQ